MWIKHFSLIKKHFACWYCRHFFFHFSCFKIKLLISEDLSWKSNIILRVFFHFCLFFCFFSFFFPVWFVCRYFPFFVTNITFCIGYKQNWSMRRRIAVMKNHGGTFISPFFNVPYFKPRDSYVYNFCRFKKKRKTTFHHLFLIALCLELVLTKPSGKRLPTLFYSIIGLGIFCSPKMRIKYFFGFVFFLFVLFKFWTP
jgi:hypothetical protein